MTCVSLVLWLGSAWAAEPAKDVEPAKDAEAAESGAAEAVKTALEAPTEEVAEERADGCPHDLVHDGGDGTCIAADRCLDGFVLDDEGACVPGWSRTGSMFGARAEHVIVRLLDGRPLAIGGADAGNQAMASTEIYDVEVRAWSPSDNLAHPRRAHAATVLPDGRVLVTGGLDPLNARLDAAEVYDPASREWTSTDPMGASRAGHAAAVLGNGRVLVTGGAGRTGAVASTELFLPRRNAFKAAAPMTTARWGHAAVALPDGRALVLGGEGDDGAPLATAEIYNPDVDAWAPAPSMPFARSQHVAAVLPDGRVLVAGGFGADGRIPSSIALYDPASATWTTRPAPEVAFDAITILADGRAVLAGGGPEVYAFDPGQGLAPMHALPASIQDGAVIGLADGRVLFTGGIASDEGQAVDTSLLLRPAYPLKSAQR